MPFRTPYRFSAAAFRNQHRLSTRDKACAERKRPSGGCFRGTASWHGDRKQTTLWPINAREDGGHGHGTQKPVECMRRPIENNSSAGQAVYEPFSGSGTTIIAAEMTGRSAHAIELDPAYIDVAIQRWQAFTGQVACLDGRSFVDVGAERRQAA